MRSGTRSLLLIPHRRTGGRSLKSSRDAPSPTETVNQGLLILARIIARETINHRLKSCVASSPERRAEEEPSIVKAAVV